MAFIQYFSEAESESLIDSYALLLKDYGMMIPDDCEDSKQLFAEFKSKNNDSFLKVNLLISWVDQSKKKCSVEIWSEEPFSKDKTLCKKVHQEISKIIRPIKISCENESIDIDQNG